MALRGNWSGGIKQLIGAAEQIGRKVTHAQLTKQFSAEALSLVQRGFRAGTDPDGHAWKPTIRGGQILRQKGTLMRSFSRDSDAKGFRVGTAVFYAAVHQFGMVIKAKTAKFLRFQIGKQWVSVPSVTIPARPMLPQDEVPKHWIERFEEITKLTIERLGKGR